MILIWKRVETEKLSQLFYNADKMSRETERLPGGDTPHGQESQYIA